MTIRVRYVFEVLPEALEPFLGAWRAVVKAHVSSGRGALESMALRSAQAPNRVEVISRWVSLEAWQRSPTSLIHPIGLIEMRRYGRLIGEPEVMEELARLS